RGSSDLNWSTARYQVVRSWAASAVSTSSSAVAASQSAAMTRGSVTARSSAGRAGRSAGTGGERRRSARRRAERDAGGAGTRPYTRGRSGGKSTLAWRRGDGREGLLVAVAFSPLVARWFGARFR